eukprot:6338930-Lingulodinium_polyedra.AAC.1
MADVPWAMSTVEQQHVSGTVMARFHPDYGQDTLMVQSMIHTMRKVGAIEDERGAAGGSAAAIAPKSYAE